MSRPLPRFIDTGNVDLPTTVYGIHGWFGDQEWIEPGLYASEEQAWAQVEKLGRSSLLGPAYVRGLHKFAVEPHEVIA